MKFPVLVIGDTHGKKKLVRELTQLLHHDIPNNAKLYGVKSVVFMGDLLDKVNNLELDTLLLYYRSIKALKKEHGLEVYVMTGNHDVHYKEGGDAAERAHVLELFSDFAHVQTGPGYSVEDGVGVEWLPWDGYHHDPVFLLGPETPGLVFMHYPLKSVVDALRIEKYLTNETIFAGRDTNKQYIAGHIHYPFDSGNEHTVGVPYPTRDKPEEYFNRMLLLPDHKTVQSIPTGHGQYFRVEISTQAQMFDVKNQILARLEAEGMLEPEYPKFKRTRVDMISYNDALSSQDVAEFKKGTDWSVRYISKVITAQAAPAQEQLVAAHRVAKSPVSVYTEYLQRHPVTTHTTEKLMELMRVHGGMA